MILFFSIPRNIFVTSSMYRSWIMMNALPYYFMKEETLAQVFSCEFCEISKNTFFTEHLWATASLHKKRSFPLRIFSVNVTKSTGNVGHIYWRNLSWKVHFLFSASNSCFRLMASLIGWEKLIQKRGNARHDFLTLSSYSKKDLQFW